MVVFCRRDVIPTIAVVVWCERLDAYTLLIHVLSSADLIACAENEASGRRMHANVAPVFMLPSCRLVRTPQKKAAECCLECCRSRFLVQLHSLGERTGRMGACCGPARSKTESETPQGVPCRAKNLLNVFFPDPGIELAKCCSSATSTNQSEPTAPTGTDHLVLRVLRFLLPTPNLSNRYGRCRLQQGHRNTNPTART